MAKLWNITMKINCNSICINYHSCKKIFNKNSYFYHCSTITFRFIYGNIKMKVRMEKRNDRTLQLGRDTSALVYALLVQKFSLLKYLKCRN